MPIVQMLLIAGRETSAIQNCARAVARAIHETLGAPMATIRVIVQEVPATHWAIGEETRDTIGAVSQTATQDTDIRAPR